MSSTDPDALLAKLDALLEKGKAPAEPSAPVSEPAPAEPLPKEPSSAGPSPSPEPDVALRETPRSDAKPTRVLVVDDSKDYRHVVKFLLQGAGCEVLEAEDGASGIKQAARERPDVLLLDFDMPGVNGYEVLQELRRRDETRKIPVILVTGSPKRGQLKNIGMDLAAFLDKPVPNEELVQTVFRVLRRPPPEVVPKQAPPPPEPEPEPELEPEDDLGDELQLEEARKEPDEAAEGLEVLSADSPIVNRVNRLLVRAVEMRASDVHIEPQEKLVLVRARVDGALKPIGKLPIALAPQLVARIKIMSNLIITERRRPQDGQIRAVIKGRKIEFRVSTLPSLHGEKVVLRVLGAASLKQGVAQLGLRPRDEEVVKRALEAPHGLLLVTGPTGSGKTTSLYTMLYDLNKPEYNVMTAEDPVEYELAGVTQVPVKAHIGLTFDSILRSFLRQDPDIMLVGEIRDLETAEIAVKAAITGHLVLSTLHTNSAPGAVMRLAHMGVAPYLLADALKLIIAQRLVRRVCKECRAPAAPSAEILGIAGKEAAGRLAKAQAGKGCTACGQSGYKGRMPLFEVMEIRSPDIRQLIIANAPVDALTKRATEEGMLSLPEAALDAVAAGETTVEEALSIVLSE